MPRAASRIPDGAAWNRAMLDRVTQLPPETMLPAAPSGAKFPTMQVVRNLSDLRAACASLRQLYGSLSLVPTMGALHAGHGALVSAAVRSGGGTVASIFVNPLQFGPNEDLLRYPRDESGDLSQLEDWGCHLVWLPEVATMYPPGDTTTVNVASLSDSWEGAARPGHFRGVATVCTKLFGQVRPEQAYFGEKDWQQLQVVRRMVTDLLLPLEIMGVRTVREADGLALSSRNRFLGAGERAIAPRLFATMQSVASQLAAGGPGLEALGTAQRDLSELGFGVDYLALVDGLTLRPIPAVRPNARLIAAARLGSVRLIDNMPVE